VWEPFVDGGDVDGGLVADGELVVAGGQGAVAFEPVDAALDGVPLFVDLAVEGGWPAPGPAPVFAVLDAVGLLGDSGRDTALTQVDTVRAGSVGLIAQDPVRAGAGSPGPRPGHRDLVQDGRELRAVATLASGDHDGQRLLPLLGGQMDLGGQATAGPAEPVIGGLIVDTAGRLGLQIPLFRAPAAC